MPSASAIIGFLKDTAERLEVERPRASDAVDRKAAGRRNSDILEMNNLAS